ncbi:MAG: NADH-quinone oxidoreductase subunit M [Acidobacteriota bacterium]
MILVWLFVILILGGFVAWLVGRRSPLLARWVSLVALGLDLLLLLTRFRPGLFELDPQSGWLLHVSWPWIPQFGIRLELGLDGLSYWLVLLTLFLGIVSVLTSWSEIDRRVGFFHFNLLWILAGILGVFLALDLFLFYFLWELMLVPMYFLIAIWGHENRTYASLKFFIFTQLSGLFMLVAILGLYFIHHTQTGIYTFSYPELVGTALDPTTARWLMAGFLAAFLVKLPAVPLHTWLPDAHTQASTAGSVVLAGLLLKTGAYGLLRFVLPLFPGAARDLALPLMIVGVVGILYGAVLAFAQTDVKRLVAYTSVSHMGFVLLGVFSLSRLAMQGVLIQMLAHGISTGALFVVAGLLQDRLGTRDMGKMGGLWARLPGMGAAALIFSVASLGLPGLGNFVGEFLILLGAWPVSAWVTGAAVVGLILATVYALWLMQSVFQGPSAEAVSAPDLNVREWLIMGSLTVAIGWLGLFPQPVLRTVAPALERIQPETYAALLAPSPPPARSQEGVHE